MTISKNYVNGMTSYTVYHMRYEAKHRKEINAKKREWYKLNGERVNAERRQRRKKEKRGSK